MKEKCTAILLAAGSGSRMGSNVPKQYMPLKGKPLIWYALKAFEQSSLIDKCILVVGQGQIAYAETEIVEKYGFKKVCAVIEGGAERFHSVQNALQEAKRMGMDGIVLIHDGARPFVDETIIRAAYQDALEYGASCTAVPVKDTIKVAGEGGCIADTPDRRLLYAAQTPQTFRISLILQAYEALTALSPKEIADMQITDDAMVVERMLSKQVKLSWGSYENIKVTTPEDLMVAEGILSRRMK